MTFIWCINILRVSMTRNSFHSKKISDWLLWHRVEGYAWIHWFKPRNVSGFDKSWKSSMLERRKQFLFTSFMKTQRQGCPSHLSGWHSMQFGSTASWSASHCVTQEWSEAETLNDWDTNNISRNSKNYRRSKLSRRMMRNLLSNHIPWLNWNTMALASASFPWEDESSSWLTLTQVTLNCFLGKRMYSSILKWSMEESVGQSVPFDQDYQSVFSLSISAVISVSSSEMVRETSSQTTLWTERWVHFVISKRVFEAECPSKTSSQEWLMFFSDIHLNLVLLIHALSETVTTLL